MKNDFKIKKKALSDIENIADFIAKDNKQAAIKMIKLFYKIFSMIAENPEIGTIRKDFTDKAVRNYQSFNRIPRYLYSNFVVLY